MKAVMFMVPGKPQGKARARTFHHTDADNIIKVVADALNGVVYHDDTQIILVQAKKVYSAIEGLDITVEEYIGG